MRSMVFAPVFKWDQFSTDSTRRKPGTHAFCYPSPPFRPWTFCRLSAASALQTPARAGDAVIEVHDVRYAVGGRPIFDGLDITARRGRITAFMGPSGTGKTTLLRLITGQAYAERGSVKVFGEEVSK